MICKVCVYEACRVWIIKKLRRRRRVLLQSVQGKEGIRQIALQTNVKTTTRKCPRKGPFDVLFEMFRVTMFSY